MSYLSWTRAAYVLFVLSILAALIKVSGLADPQSLASRPADAEPAEAPAGQVLAQQAGSETVPADPATADPATAEATSA
jgi:hypothetical protein